MKPVQLTVFIIWGALCASLLVYAGMISSMTFLPGKADTSSLGNIIALAAGSAAALSFVLRKLLLDGFAAGTLTLDDPANRGRFIAGNIVVFALSEGIGALGFVNGITSGGRIEAWLPYIALAFALMVLHIPLPSRFQPRNDSYQR
ncbi:MAG TPA: hypothetical protein DDZ88_05840 [Verrucomicrobiales bacterium]|nr:hypothetical protein [Verrucomicrobiales bacterium]